MGFFGGIKKVVKPFVDVPKWVGYEQLKGVTGWVKGLFKRTFVIRKQNYNETFEQAMVRLKLTEQDLAKRTHEFTWLVRFWLALFFLVILYAAYMAGIASWAGLIISISVSLLTLSQAFRYHFWLFQIRHRKLGCTLREWWHSRVTTEKNQ